MHVKQQFSILTELPFYLPLDQSKVKHSLGFRPSLAPLVIPKLNTQIKKYLAAFGFEQTTAQQAACLWFAWYCNCIKIHLRFGSKVNRDRNWQSQICR